MELALSDAESLSHLRAMRKFFSYSRLKPKLRPRLRRYALKAAETVYCHPGLTIITGGSTHLELAPIRCPTYDT
jgi:hypothetical protein